MSRVSVSALLIQRGFDSPTARTARMLINAARRLRPFATVESLSEILIRCIDMYRFNH
jgi:hypothetical protein